MYLDWYFFYIVSKLDTSLIILFYFILLVGIICFRLWKNMVPTLCGFTRTFERHTSCYSKWSLTLKNVAYITVVSSRKKMKFKVILIKIYLSFIGIPMFTGNIHPLVLVRECIKITLIWWSLSMVSVSFFFISCYLGRVKGLTVGFFKFNLKMHW